MAWSGGTYTKGNNATGGWAGDASSGIGIEAGRHDTQDNDFASGINQCLNKDGSNSATGNLNIGNYKITNLAAGTALTDAATLSQVQNGTSAYLGTTGGTSTAFTVTATPTITSLVTGASYSFKANAANGSAATLKIDATAATTMKRQGTALVGNEFIANDIVTVVYDGTNFQIVSVSQAPLYVDRTNNRVGIGTTAPGVPLDVQTTGGDTLYGRQFSANTTGAVISLQKSRGASVGTNTIVSSGDNLGTLNFAGANGTGFTSGANFIAQVDGTPGASNDMPTRFVWEVSADGSGTPTERMRLSSGGYLGIGVTSPTQNIDVANIVRARNGFRVTANSGTNEWQMGPYTTTTDWQLTHSSNSFSSYSNYITVTTGGLVTINGTSNFSAKLTSNQDAASSAAIDAWVSASSSTGIPGIRIIKKDNDATGNQTFVLFYIDNGNANCGKIVANGANQAAFASTSDVRLKENIVDLPNQLENICNLRPVEFDYKDGSGHQIGFIAQEVSEIYPDLINSNTEGYFDVIGLDKNWSRAIKAIQELNDKVEALQARVAELEA
jgi:hypothetical protein